MFFFRFFLKNQQFFDFFRKPTSFSLSLKVFLKSPRPPLALMRDFSKITPSLFTIKEGSTSFPKPLSPQGTGDVPTALLGAQTASL